MATGIEINDVLTRINNFATNNQVERVRLLAAAVIPYGRIEDHSKKVPEIYREIKLVHKEATIPLLIRLLRKAGVEPKYVSLLDRFLPVHETTEDLSSLYFTELLVTVSDHLGNNDYLRRLTNRIPDSKLGMSAERVKTSVQLFQILLYQETLSLQCKEESLKLLSRWLNDIGRRDIVNLVDEALAAKQQPDQSQLLPLAQKQAKSHSTYRISHGSVSSATFDKKPQNYPAISKTLATWKWKRTDLYKSIYKHSNRTFSKEVKMKSSLQSKLKDVTLTFVLVPYGLDHNAGSCMTMIVKVDMNKRSQQMKEMAQLHLQITSQTQGGNEFLSTKDERRKLETFTIYDILPHSILKQVHTKHVEVVVEAYLTFPSRYDDIGSDLSPSHTMDQMSIASHRDVEDQESLSQVIEQYKKLNLSKRDISDDDLQFVLKTHSRYLKSLRVIDLSFNHIGNGGVKCLDAILKFGNCRWLHTLDLCGNQISDEGAKNLENYLKKCPIQALNLCGNQIGNEGAKRLGEHIKNCRHLQTLNLSDNKIGDEGAKSLGLGVSECPNLLTLNLSDNKIGDEGAKRLGLGVSECPNLLTLNLSSNKIGDEGATNLVWGQWGVHNLNLSGNQIGDKGAERLGVRLIASKLQTLNLSDNRITDEGARNLGVALRMCPSLKTLNLRRNQIKSNKTLLSCNLTVEFLLDKENPSKLEFHKYKSENDPKIFKVFLIGYHQLGKVVSKYYQCAENSTHVPFIDPVTVLVCDHQGIEHTLVDHDITLTIPPGAIPKGMIVHFELGVALYGPFSFPSDTRPISPILWMCPQEEIEFNSPFMVTLPHFLTGLSQQELAQLGVGFAKADHNNYSGSKESQNVIFNFQPCSVQPQFSYKEKQGFAALVTKHCCFICLTAKQCPLLARKIGFCFSRIDTLSVSTHVVNFCVTFCLSSCLKALMSQFAFVTDVRKRHFHFNHDEESKPHLLITVQNHFQDKYHGEVDPPDGKIMMSTVDFWEDGCDEVLMKFKHDEKMYPPRVIVHFIPLGDRNGFQCTMNITVAGYKSDNKLDSEVNLPLVPRSLRPFLNSTTWREDVTCTSFNRETKKLTFTDHLKIYQYLQVLDERDIILLGQALGLLRPKLKKMRTLPEDMIDAWLHQQDHVLITSGQPTWKSLCEALKSVKQHGIAKEIQEKEFTTSKTLLATQASNDLVDL